MVWVEIEGIFDGFDDVFEESTRLIEECQSEIQSEERDFDIREIIKSTTNI